MSVDLRVNRISAISGHLPRLEGRRMRRGASGTPVCACLPNEGDAQRWRLIRQTLIYLQPLVACAPDPGRMQCRSSRGEEKKVGSKNECMHVALLQTHCCLGLPYMALIDA